MEPPSTLFSIFLRLFLSVGFLIGFYSDFFSKEQKKQKKLKKEERKKKKAEDELGGVTKKRKGIHLILFFCSWFSLFLF